MKLFNLIKFFFYLFYRTEEFDHKLYEFYLFRERIFLTYNVYKNKVRIFLIFEELSIHVISDGKIWLSYSTNGEKCFYNVKFKTNCEYKPCSIIKASFMMKLTKKGKIAVFNVIALKTKSFLLNEKI